MSCLGRWARALGVEAGRPSVMRRLACTHSSSSASFWKAAPPCSASLPSGNCPSAGFGYQNAHLEVIPETPRLLQCRTEHLVPPNVRIRYRSAREPHCLRRSATSIQASVPPHLLEMLTERKLEFGSSKHTGNVLTQKLRVLHPHHFLHP